MRHSKSPWLVLIIVMLVLVNVGCNKNNEEKLDGIMIGLVQSDFLDLEDSSDLYTVEEVTEDIDTTNQYSELEESLKFEPTNQVTEDTAISDTDIAVEEMPEFLKDETWSRVYPEEDKEEEEVEEEETTTKSLTDQSATTETTPKDTETTGKSSQTTGVVKDEAETAVEEVDTKTEDIDVEIDSECYFKIGTDYSGQSVSPRDYIKMTLVVMTDDNESETVDFQIFAVPEGNNLYRSGYYMLGYGYNIDVVNGQAQYTKYWNGENVYGNFLPKGDYSIYIYYKIRDDDDALLKDDGRYWGYSTDYYLDLE